MIARVTLGARVSGRAFVPGDKSISHRWLILAGLARGSSELRGLPASLDLQATARGVRALLAEPQPDLDRWCTGEGHSGPLEAGTNPGSTFGSVLRVHGGGRKGLRAPEGSIDCLNSGTTMRLLAGAVAASGFTTVLDGDESLQARPMERVARPLRLMGARVETTEGKPPVRISGGGLRGIRYELPIPSAQVKGAALLAGLGAEGPTTVVGPWPLRDHTERAIEALGGPVRRSDSETTVEPFEPDGFSGAVPGDPSSAAFLAAAAILTGSEVTVEGVGLNPTRTAFLDWLQRMGATAEWQETGRTVGEPVGSLRVAAAQGGIRGITVPSGDLPAVIDEVPVLAVVAAHAEGESRFEGAAELRVKESDRLTGLAEAIRELGGEAEVQGDALVVGGGGLAGGRTDARRDHRLAMALAVGALAARGPTEIAGMEWAAVSFPGFLEALSALGAAVEALR